MSTEMMLIELAAFVHQKYFKERKMPFDELVLPVTFHRKHFIQF